VGCLALCHASLRSATIASYGVVVLLLLTMCGGEPAWSQAGYEKKAPPTPIPTVNRAGEIQKEREAVYEGYARLFVLGHVFTRFLGMEGILPGSINLDFLANQPYLAEAGDVFIYRASPRGDVMWPLVLPTAPKETPTPEPTVTPTPPPVVEQAATPTPTPTVTPTEVVPPPLKLQAVTQSNKGSLIMISDVMLEVGDTINGATIEEIHGRYARIIYYGKEFFVTPKGTLRPEDFKEEDLSLE
jgi:hypothetical protein